MKRMNFLLVFMLVSSQILMAGGLKTNVNQSAAWARTLSRDATLDIDAVYFNPAGLAHMSNGLHLSLSNMSIFQTRTITSDYRFLSPTPKTYETDLVAPFFPNLYVAYKMDKWTFSGGFGIVGGGGSADFPNGIPDFEVPIASIPTQLEALVGPQPAIDGYNMLSSFNGSSAYLGYQIGATYAINDIFSVAIGGRLVTAKNSYEGALTDVTLNVPLFGADPVTPGNYLRGVIPFIPPSTPGYDLIVAGLLAGADTFDEETADKYLNATQKGTGFTPIISLNIHPSDMFNFAIRYEHHTKIELTNDTDVDDVGMFPQGEKVRADLPGMFAVGAWVRPIPKLTASLGFNYFLDKSAYYGNMDAAGEQIDNEKTIDENGFTYSIALEYRLIDMLGLSAGFTSGNNGVNDDYQSNITYELKSKTWGAGVFVDVGEKVTINAGVNFTSYDDYSQPESYLLSPGVPASAVPYTDTYEKKTTIFAIGVDFHL
jgi:long-subunit fatty acid transport protein